jgi:two-component system, LuxR family, sensor kinase FixL
VIDLADAATLLLDAEPLPALLVTPAGRPERLNSALKQLIGAGVAESWLAPNHLALVRACHAQQRAIQDVEVQAEGRHLLWTYVPQPLVDRVLVRGRDATDMLRRHHEATVAHRLYRLIIENTTDLISRHTPDGQFLDASPASWTLLGYWPEQLRGQTIQSLFHPQERDLLLERFHAALQQDGYLTMTYRIRHQAGHYLWFETASRAIRETYTGSVVEVVSVSRDISARIHSEENTRRLQDELAHAARLATLGELASGIAHEINQPLAAIVNYASASQRYLTPLIDQHEPLERVAQGLQRINEQANHASAVIQRLRGFLRKGQRRLQRINPLQLAREAIGLCAWEAGHNQVTILEQLEDRLPDVQVDPILLQQVLLNLLRNAIEANRERHPDTPSTVRLHLCSDGDRVSIVVLDEGPGVAPEDLDRLFTPFYTSKPQGLGLGLSMSQGIVEGFGGGLEAAPAETGGLRLHCWLPAIASTTTTSDT